MQTNATDLSALDLVLGFAVFLSFITFAFCLSSLRNHVDEGKLRDEKSVSGIMAAQIPPERVLTEAGLRRAQIGKVALVVSMFLIAVILVRKNFL